MFDFEVTLDEEGLRAAVDSAGHDMVDTARGVLSVVGIETVAHLRSLTAEMRPPAHPDGAPRPAHPGHWADVTGELANAFAWEVRSEGDEVQLALSNSAGHAVHLEARDGYFVLRGVTDPGGPVEDALRKAASMVAPGWEVRYG